MLHRSNSAYAAANSVPRAPRGSGASRPDPFSGRPMGSILAEGTAGAIFEIVEAPVLLVITFFKRSLTWGTSYFQSALELWFEGRPRLD